MAAVGMNTGSKGRQKGKLEDDERKWRTYEIDEKAEDGLVRKGCLPDERWRPGTPRLVESTRSIFLDRI
jgi:hypothetical protein